MEERPFALIGVDSRDKLHRIRRYMHENDFRWRLFYLGNDTAVCDAYAIESHPTAITLNAQGEIVHRGASPDLQIVESLVVEAEAQRAAQAGADPPLPPRSE